MMRSGRPNPNRERYAAIGQELRRVFDTVVNEPVPQEMLALLSERSDPTGDETTSSEASAS